MISLAVWITSDEARVFKFTVNGVESHVLHHRGKQHVTNDHGRHHTQGPDADHFFHEVVEHLIQYKADRWLLVGPGLAKDHLKTHIEKHHAPYTKNIFGVETMDKATDGEITNFAHNFFKHKGVFDNLN